MQFVKLTSLEEVETDVENIESDIADGESDIESDNLSVATDSSGGSEKYIQNNEHSLLSKDKKYNWIDIMPETRTRRARAENIITAYFLKFYPYAHNLDCVTLFSNFRSNIICIR